ncbi:hypothetical protein [Streptomyces sp. Act143]|uniref:hypothetical protein n=1 Tax=Streptomyces sp. Act143 TaxID=2200760 RepID=UPI00215A70A6|nr:hypothetical protein [Streptomyces sp. Act143]
MSRHTRRRSPLQIRLPATGGAVLAVGSGGELPASITVLGSLAKVMNAGGDGRLQVVQRPLPDGQETLCRPERAGDFFCGGNTGNSTVTGYRTGTHGRLALTNDVGVATPPSVRSQGVIDLAVTRDAKFLYADSGMQGIAAV